MYRNLLFALPIIFAVSALQAADEGSDELSPQLLAQIQTECAEHVAQTGLIGDAAEQMKWLCETNLRDYDNSEE